MLLKHSKEMTFTTISTHLINKCLEFVGLYMKRKWERTLKNLIYLTDLTRRNDK